MSSYPPTPTVQLISSQLNRNLDTEERQCIQWLSAKGIAKLNRDQCAGVPIETTLMDFKIAYRNLRRQCTALAETLQDTESLMAEKPMSPVRKQVVGKNDENPHSLSLRNRTASAPTTTLRKFLQRNVRHFSEHALTPSDVATLMRKLQSEDGKLDLDETVSEDELVHMALELRDHDLRTHALLAAETLSTNISISCLAPTFSLVSTGSSSSDSSASTHASVHADTDDEDSRTPTSPTHSSAGECPEGSEGEAPRRFSDDDDNGLPLPPPTLAGFSSAFAFPYNQQRRTLAHPASLSSLVGRQALGSPSGSPKLLPLFSSLPDLTSGGSPHGSPKLPPLGQQPRCKVFETPRGKHRKVTMDPSESWFDLATPRCPEPTQRMNLLDPLEAKPMMPNSELVEEQRTPPPSTGGPTETDLPNRPVQVHRVSSMKSILKCRNESSSSLSPQCLSSSSTAFSPAPRRRSHSGPAARFGSISVIEIPGRAPTPPSPITPLPSVKIASSQEEDEPPCPIPAYILSGPSGNAIRAALKAKNIALAQSDRKFGIDDEEDETRKSEADRKMDAMLNGNNPLRRSRSMPTTGFGFLKRGLKGLFS